MIKIKTFIYEGYHVPSASTIDEEINNFIKNHKVISVTPVTLAGGLGQTMPESAIIYTIVYEEAE